MVMTDTNTVTVDNCNTKREIEIIVEQLLGTVRVRVVTHSVKHVENRL